MENFNSSERIPPDLRKILTPERVASFKAEAAGIQLLYATERVDKPILQELFKLAEQRQAAQQMRSMQAGERVNVSENRPALHTAMRDLFENHPRSPAAQEAVTLAQKEIDKLRLFLSQPSIFTTLIQIGIGGSSLGPEAIYLGLEAYGIPGRKAYFLSNVDPDEATRVLNQVDLAKTLIVVVSKSGLSQR
jgi:glucose-6-phosphate isomerase